MEIGLSLIVSLILGAAFGYFGWTLVRRSIIKGAQDEANELLQEVKDDLEIKEIERNERIQEIEGEAWMRVENDLLKSDERIEELQEMVDEKKQKADQTYSQERQKLVEKDRDLKEQEGKLRTAQGEFDKKKSAVTEVNRNFVERLTERLQMKVDEVKAQISTKLVNEAQERSRKQIEMNEEDCKEHAETRAKNFLDTALNRFARPYCAERGIGSVNFPDAKAKQLFCDPAGANIKAVQDACGCDIVVEEGSDLVGVAGFDPVRRELTRRTLERILKEKKSITPEFIKKIAENQKKELFNNIRRDGDNVAKELKLEGMHPEIRQMMGSLRYRYSFTQNQHFHCAEVGWLCGLLASELGVDIRKARRSGLLHDIGKSMDHAQEGGHAPIGADFIAARGEAADIVHAVRAHHYDEPPSSDTAFLVIAADAISGARPGARRSTLESYNQKVTELQDIARSFQGVTDVYVLSGGRECRVFVNGKKVDDNRALDLSRQIAARVEAECSYPGQIKVVVVRETLVNESTMNTKAHA